MDKLHVALATTTALLLGIGIGHASTYDRFRFFSFFVGFFGYSRALIID